MATFTFAGEARAQLIYAWNNPNGGNYGSSSNWFPGAGAPPGPGDGADFSLAATYTVNFFSDFTVDEVFVGPGNVTWDLNPSGTSRTYTVTGAVVVSGPTTLLTARDGRVRASALNVSNDGDFVAATGDAIDVDAINIMGTGSSFTHSSLLAIALSRPGSMTIQGGGSANSGAGLIGFSSGVTGTVIVNGAQSKWTNTTGLFIGDLGMGILTIEAEGSVSNVVGSLGDRSGGTGTVTVDGQGSTWQNTGDLTVGNRGMGTLNIMGGGFVSSLAGSIGNQPGSSGMVTVTGEGSKWMSTGMGFGFDVGLDGMGMLNIQEGGAVESMGGIIGRRIGSQGTVFVQGAGSNWTDHGAALIVGFAGAGTMNILDGGTVSNGNAFLGSAGNAVGMVSVDGDDSIWTNNGDLFVGGDGSG